MISIPPRSLPPLPPRVAAETRVKALRADLALAQAPLVRAALEYEIGALSEVRLGDTAEATRCYQAAADEAPEFRPPLFALARLLQGQHADTQLANVLSALIDASPDGGDAATLLVDLGVLREDRLGDAAGARQCFEQALARDESSRAAMLMLERMLRAQGDAAGAAKLSKARAEHTRDPQLREALLCEVAEEQTRAGQIDEAIVSLLAAANGSPRRLSILERVVRLARAQQRPAVAAQALEEMAELLGGIAASPDLPERRAWLLREAGRLRLVELHDPSGATHDYDAARALRADDELILFEQLAANVAADQIDPARRVTEQLLARAHDDAPRTAMLQFQLAELWQRQGDSEQARAALRAALQADPESPAVLAVLEDSLLDAEEFGELCDHLEERAARSQGANRQAALRRAASIAGDRAGDHARALRLHRTLIAEAQASKGTDPRMLQTLLREAFGCASLGRDPQGIVWTARELSGLALEDDETSALLRACYEAQLALSDMPAAHDTLRLALLHPACERWALYGALVVGALRRDFRLLAEAHERLADSADSVDLATAHLCAEARALTRVGDFASALACLQRAIERSPGHPYAVALLEELLLARGEATDAVHVLREAAAVARTAHASELSLLHAGAAAETAARVDLAAQSYEEAIDRDRNALSALWSLRRLGERAGDPRISLSALEGIALREAEVERAGIAHVELAERYDSMGKPELAVSPLLAAADGTAPFETSVAALLLSHKALDAGLYGRALAAVRLQLTGQERAFIERESIAEALFDEPDHALALLRETSTEQAPSSSDTLAQLFASSERKGRIEALYTLASLTRDPVASAELALHAQRITRAFREQSPEDLVRDAVRAADRGPDSALTALGLDEALPLDADPALRVRALEARLRHAAPELAHGLEVMLARALLDAGRDDDAAARARSVLARDPRELSTWETLRVAARAHALADVVLACDTLAEHTSGAARALLLQEAAEVLEDELGRPSDAEVRLRAALAADDSRLTAFERLHDLLVARHDIEGLVGLVSGRVRVVGSEEERCDLLYEQARLLRALGEREAALACADEVLSSQPAHAGALALSAEIYASQQDWPGAIAALRILSQADVPDAQRRLARLGAADFLERNVRDLPGAYQELALLARDGLADLVVWKRMAELSQRAQLWNEAVGALEQAAELSSGGARANLERRAGQILARDAHHHEAARRAYARALAALPTDIDACEELHALLADAERASLTTTFTATLLGALSREPGQPELLRALHRVGLLANDRLLQHVALCALRTLELASPEEIDAYARLDAHAKELPSDDFSDEHFVALGNSGLSDAAFTFARIASKVWLDLHDDSPARHGVTRHDRVSKQRPADAVHQALARWTTSFGLSVGELYVGGDDTRGLRMVLRPGHEHAWVLGRDVNPPLDKRARMQLAEQCVAMRLQVAPLVSLDRAAARDLLHAALGLVDTSATSETSEGRALREQLARKLSRGQRRELEAARARLQNPARELDSLLDAVRLLSLRAGLLACCDLRTTFEALLGPRFDPEQVGSSPAALALLRFWTSNSLLALRRELGLDV